IPSPLQHFAACLVEPGVRSRRPTRVGPQPKVGAMTVWLAIALALIAATLGISGCVAYIVITLTRAAALLGTRLGVAELQIIKVSIEPSRRRRQHAELRRLRLGVSPT